MIERAIKRFRESRGARKLAGEIIFCTRGVKIEGLENLPKSPYIGAINHMGWAEGPVVSFFLPDLPHPMVEAKSLEMKIIGSFAREMGYFPVKRGEFNRPAIRTALRLLEEGKVLVIPPEGTRGRGKERTALKRAKAGIIYLARKANVSVVPIAIWGTENILPLAEEEGFSLVEMLSLLVPFGKEKIHVNIGEPFVEHLSSPLEHLDSEMRMSYAHELMVRIRNLLPPQYHGFYANWEENQGE